MKCDYVISITILQGARRQGDAELECSARAVAKKYSGKPVKLMNIVVLQSTIEQDPKNWISTTARELKELAGDAFSAATNHARTFNNPGGIGLYWACHGNSEATDPSAETLAFWTSLFYGEEIRFVKINYNSCNSGGANDRYVEGSSLKKFCDALAAQLGDSAAAKLEALAVAGYALTVELVDKDDVYYKSLSPEPDFAPIPEGVHNAAVAYPPRGPRIYAPLTPQHKAAEVKESTKGKEVVTAAKLYKDAEGPGKNKAARNMRNAIDKFKKSNEYKAIQGYIQRKPILVYSSGRWERKGIASFTDNANIFEMVQFITAVNDFSTATRKQHYDDALAVLVPD